MSPFDLVRLAWVTPQVRVIFPGALLMLGAFLATFPTTGGRLVCDRGMCVQEQTAAFGTVRDAIIYPTSEIDRFWVEKGAQGETRRVVIELRGISQPLTIPFTMNQRDVDRIAMEGSRFLTEGRQERFVAAQEVQGIQSFYKPGALILLLAGMGLAGWTFRTYPRDELRW